MTLKQLMEYNLYVDIEKTLGRKNYSSTTKLCVHVLFSGTWHQPHLKRDAHQEYLDQHIEGALRFDIAEVRDKSSPLPFMLPPAEQFEEQVGKVLLRAQCV